MGWFSDKGKEGTFIEGREGKEHIHNDGTKGKDNYAAKVTYDKGEKTSEKNAGWGHTKSSRDKK